jgi:formyltetrahydrofolate deformylase
MTVGAAPWTTYVLTLQCPDAPGIVRAAAEGIFEVDGNIVENDQFTDPATGQFCMRSRFEAASDDLDDVRSTILARLAHLDPRLGIRRESEHRRALVMVSKEDHCLVDLLARRDHGELPLDIAMVVSNHTDCEAIALRSGVPFAHIPVTPASKEGAEAALLALIEEHRIDFVVLARYMQILSAQLCDRLEGRVINIHHSFLPGFKGARPYHQAYDRGVKLIGATAHYVTADLDEGPIIDQDVARVSHARGPADLIAIGRDLERTVLARAVRLEAEDRIALVGRRTVVFSQ